MYIPRTTEEILKNLSDSPLGRCLILTGARQTGKTTLLRKQFGDEYIYISFDEALIRSSIKDRSAADWLHRGNKFIFDEVQKAPDFFHTVKAMLDQSQDDIRIILSGSAQIQLLTKVRESLAGRSVTRELYPLTSYELAGCTGTVLQELLSCRGAADIKNILKSLSFYPHEPQKTAKVKKQFQHLLDWGGMPALLHLTEDEHRWIWLTEYCQTYLQRDVTDLGKVADLDNFLRLEKLAAMRTAGVLNYADLARDADLSAITTKKYLQYFTLSYQTFLLQPYRNRLKERLIKSPKIHWLDLGVQRVLTGLRAGLTGAQFESAVVSEVYKTCRTNSQPAELFYLRTKDGREVDLLIKLPDKRYIALEMKAGTRAAQMDARHMRDMQQLLDGPLLAGIVIYLGDEVKIWDKNLYAIPAHLLFIAP